MMYLAKASTPFKRTMSWGLKGPWHTTSPFSTCSPSKTSMLRHFGIRVSTGSSSTGVITSRCLPLVGRPKLTTPEASASTAGSLGLRASKRSATRGRPPVMSRGLGAFLGNAGNDVANMHRILVLQVEDGVAGQGIGRILGRIPFPGRIDQHQRRTQVLARGRTVLRIEHGNVGQAGQLVRFAG